MEAGDVHVFLCRGHGVLQAGVFGGWQGGEGVTPAEPEGGVGGCVAFLLALLSRMSKPYKNTQNLNFPCGLGMTRRALVNTQGGAGASAGLALIYRHTYVCIKLCARWSTRLPFVLVFRRDVSK